jgi:multidrug efflux pump subunit AcrA (membrane-fusion protein)
VSAGQAVTVRLDAYPDLALPGRLAQVSPIASPGSFSNRVRSFTALVTIDGSNARLLPDLTAAVDVETERVTGVLLVPRDALRQQAERTLVRVRKGDGVTEREVVLGPQDEVEAVVLRGLEPGQTVLRHWR